jgi:hypothetical protein
MKIAALVLFQQVIACIVFTMLLSVKCMSDTQRRSNDVCNDFCSCLIQNNTTSLKKQLDPVLSKINQAGTLEEKLYALKTWIENQPCISQVEAEKGLVETRIPIKIFNVYYQTNNQTEKATIDVSIEKNAVLKFSKLN